MNTNSKKINAAKSLCEELSQDDGIDPRTFFSSNSKNTFNRKTHQLGKEIQHTLSLTLAGELNDPILSNLQVFGVEPIPESGDFMIILGWTGQPELYNAREITFTVQKISGFLRSEVAHSINRKRVPEFSFRLLAPGEVQQ